MSDVVSETFAPHTVGPATRRQMFELMAKVYDAVDEATVVSIRERLIAAGYDQAEIQDLKGAKALFVKDPDGLRFEITYYPPGVNVVD